MHQLPEAQFPPQPDQAHVPELVESTDPASQVTNMAPQNAGNPASNVVIEDVPIEHIGRKRSKKTSDVWEHFEVIVTKNKNIVDVVSLSDPRFKVPFLQYCYGKIYGKEIGGIHVLKIVANLQSLFEEYKQSDVSGVNGANVGNSGNKDACNVFFGDYSDFISKASVSVEKSQLELYLEEPTRDFTEDLDVLDFWNKSSMRFPELARMACDLLSIPVSTVASESAFSTGGKIITGI